MESAHRISVGKARDIISHYAVSRRGFEQRAGKGGEFFGVRHVMLKKQLYQRERLFFFCFRYGIGVNACEHEFVQFEVHRFKLGGLLYERFAEAVADDVEYKAVDPRALAVTEHFGAVLWQIFFFENSCGDRVLYVVVYVGKPVCVFYYLALQRRGLAAEFVIDDAVPDFKRQVETFAVVFEKFDNSQALFVVRKAAIYQLVEHAFSRMPERRMSEIVPESDRLYEVLVEIEGARNRPAYLRDFEGMGESSAVMISFGRNENLRLVLKTTERLAVYYSVAVAHEVGT